MRLSAIPNKMRTKIDFTDIQQIKQRISDIPHPTIKNDLECTLMTPGRKLLEHLANCLDELRVVYGGEIITAMSLNKPEFGNTIDIYAARNRAVLDRVTKKFLPTVVDAGFTYVDSTKRRGENVTSWILCYGDLKYRIRTIEFNDITSEILGSYSIITEQMQLAQILCDLCEGNVFSYENYYERLKSFANKKPMDLYAVVELLKNCFQIQVNNLDTLLYKMVYDMNTVWEMCQTVDAIQRDIVLQFIASIIRVWYDGNETNSRVALLWLDGVIKTKSVLGGTYALQACGLLPVSYPCRITVLSATAADFNEHPLMRTVAHPNANFFDDCQEIEGIKNLVLPTKERALIDYADGALFTADTMDMAIIKYCETVDSLNALYKTAEKFDVSIALIDTLIGYAYCNLPIKDLVVDK